MNKKLETLMERVPSWPQKAQQEAARALATIEEEHVRRPLTAGERAKLAANGYRFSNLVESIVTSPQFLTKRGRDDLATN